MSAENWSIRTELEVTARVYCSEANHSLHVYQFAVEQRCLSLTLKSICASRLNCVRQVRLNRVKYTETSCGISGEFRL